MAKPATPLRLEPSAEPIRTAYAVERKADGWTTVTYQLRGDRVVGRHETTMDSRIVCEQRVLTEMGRE